MSGSIVQSVLMRLVAGSTLTAESINRFYGSANASDVIAQITRKGVPVDRARVDGRVVYSLSRNIGTTYMILARLLAGETLTSTQIAEQYGLGSPHSVIYQLRKRGNKIETSLVKTALGGRVAHYSM